MLNTRYTGDFFNSEIIEKFGKQMFWNFKNKKVFDFFFIYLKMYKQLFEFWKWI